jgi:hypothetical protein
MLGCLSGRARTPTPCIDHSFKRRRLEIVTLVVANTRVSTNADTVGSGWCHEHQEQRDARNDSADDHGYHVRRCSVTTNHIPNMHCLQTCSGKENTWRTQVHRPVDQMSEPCSAVLECALATAHSRSVFEGQGCDRGKLGSAVGCAEKSSRITPHKMPASPSLRHFRKSTHCAVSTDWDFHWISKK